MRELLNWSCEPEVATSSFEPTVSDSEARSLRAGRPCGKFVLLDLLSLRKCSMMAQVRSGYRRAGYILDDEEDGVEVQLA